MGRCLTRVGRINLSKIFTAGHKSETGLYEVESSAGFFGLRSGMMVLIFQMSGMMQVAELMLNRSVRYCRPLGPMCLRCNVDMLSGPSALEALAFLMASVVCSFVYTIGLSSDIFLLSLVVVLFVFVLTCLVTVVNCLFFINCYSITVAPNN